MGYVILRTQKLKSGAAIQRSMKHAFRTQTTPNADISRTPANTHIGAQNVDEGLANFNARLATQDKVRKNAVLAIEYLISGSPDDLQGKTREQQDAYFRDALKWLEDKHGKANVTYAGIHRDETTPHLYAYVVPIDEHGKLNCRSFLGGPKALNQMQSNFTAEVGQKHGLQRGIEGSKAKHIDIQDYYRRANAAFEPLPEVKTPLPKLRPEPEKPGMFAGREARDEYAKWEKEREAAQAQRQKHVAEVKAQRDVAVETAKRHQAQAMQAGALKIQVEQLKKANGQLKQKASIAALFTPDEIKAAEIRRHQEVAEKTRLAELARQNKIILGEVTNRIQALPKLSGNSQVFGKIAALALKNVGWDASRIDWKVLEWRAIDEMIVGHGLSAENVAKAVLTHSPIRVDPASHAELEDRIKLKGPELEAKYQDERRQLIAREIIAPVKGKRAGPQM